MEKGRKTKAMEKPKVQNIVEIFNLQLEYSLPVVEEKCSVQRVFASDKENLGFYEAGETIDDFLFRSYTNLVTPSLEGSGFFICKVEMFNHNLLKT